MGIPISSKTPILPPAPRSDDERLAAARFVASQARDKEDAIMLLEMLDLGPDVALAREVKVQRYP